MPIRTAASLTLLLPLLLPAFAVACLAVCYLSGHPLRAGLLNADALYLPMLFDDLLTRGGRLSDWYLTPAPCFFPDYPLYLAAWWMAPTSYYQIIVFGVLQCALLFGAVALLARALGARAVLPAAACSLTLFAWLAASGREPFVLLLSNAYHFGGFLAVLLAAAWLRFEASASRAGLGAAHLLPARRAPALLLAGACAFTLGIGMATARQWQAHPIESAYYPADSACLDRALARMDLHHGVAQYWDAKPFQRFSRSGIVLAQHIASLEELPWITSRRYFRPAYDFALVGPDAPPPHHIPAARLEAINGPPLARVRCGAYTILLYGRDGMRVY